MRFIKFAFIGALLGGSSVFAATAPSQKDLIKVSDKMTQKCVEYYRVGSELYCSTKPLSAQTIDPNIQKYETQKIVFDSRPWQAVWGKKLSTIQTVEYVPQGENINSWHELITSQFFPRLNRKFTPKEAAEATIAELKKSGFSPVVTFHQVTSDVVIWEFRIESPAAQAQDELQKITKDSEGIYVLHYAIKEADMGQKRRDLWIKNLSESGILSKN